MFAELEKRALNINAKRLGEETAKIMMIKEVFSNRVIIIDEAHNTNPNSDLMKGRDRDIKVFPECIEKVLRYSENTKLVLLSATPINNKPQEILWLLNLLLLNDNRGTIQENEVFDSDDKLLPSGKELLLKKSRGYISHIRSEDPVTYPTRQNMYRNQNNNYRIYYPGKPYNKKKLKLDKKRNIKNYDLIWLIDHAMSNIHYSNYLNSSNYAEGKITTFKTGLGTKNSGEKNYSMMYPKKSSKVLIQ